MSTDQSTVARPTTAVTNRRHRLRQLGVQSAYLLTGLPVAVVSFSVLVSLVALGVSLVITLVGLPILALAWLVARQFAQLERRRMTWVSGEASAPPPYRSGRGGIRGLLDLVLDPQALRDLVHGIGILVVSSVTWSVAVVWAAMTPLTLAWLAAGDGATSQARRVPDWLGVESSAGRTWLYVATAAFCLLTLPLVVRGLTALQVAFGRMLLTRPGAPSMARS